jgi:hypothetical protein
MTVSMISFLTLPLKPEDKKANRGPRLRTGALSTYLHMCRRVAAPVVKEIFKMRCVGTL